MKKSNDYGNDATSDIQPNSEGMFSGTVILSIGASTGIGAARLFVREAPRSCSARGPRRHSLSSTTSCRPVGPTSSTSRATSALPPQVQAFVDAAMQRLGLAGFAPASNTAATIYGWMHADSAWIKGSRRCSSSLSVGSAARKALIVIAAWNATSDRTDEWTVGCHQGQVTRIPTRRRLAICG